MTRVAHASGRSLRTVALEPFAWTAREYGELLDRERLARFEREGEEFRLCARVRAALLDGAAFEREWDAFQSRITGEDQEPSEQRVSRRLVEVQAVLAELAALEQQGCRWAPTAS